MVQWRNPEGLCKRCGGGLDDSPDPGFAPALPSTAGMRIPAWLIVVAAAFVFVALTAYLTLPRLFNLRGTPVGTFTDSMKLVRLELPDGWRHLRLDRGDLPMPHEDNESFWDSLRGSFFLGDIDWPQGILYLRIVSFGFSVGTPQNRDWRQMATAEHARFTTHVARLGGTYEALGESVEDAEVVVEAVGPDGEPDPDAPPRTSRVMLVRIEGKVVTTKPFIAWSDGGTFRMSSVTYTFQTREYWYQVVVLEDRADVVAPQFERIVAGARIRQTKG